MTLGPEYERAQELDASLIQSKVPAEAPGSAELDRPRHGRTPNVLRLDFYVPSIGGERKNGPLNSHWRGRKLRSGGDLTSETAGSIQLAGKFMFRLAGVQSTWNTVRCSVNLLGILIEPLFSGGLLVT